MSFNREMVLRILAVAALGLPACDDESSSSTDTDGNVSADGTLAPDGAAPDGATPDAAQPDARVAVERPAAPENGGIHSFASRCVTMDVAAFGSADIRFVRSDESAFVFDGADDSEASKFHMRAADLGTFLFYDAEGHYLTADAEAATYPRVATLESDVSRVDDSFKSPAEWVLEVSAHDATRFQLRHFATEQYLGMEGLTAELDDAAIVTLYPSEGCAEFPEMSLDAAGDPERTEWPDGEVYGIVETHGHLLTNFAFGGGGIFHGAPFHRLGVEHALSSCEQHHEADGRRDLIGYAIDGNAPADDLVTALISGRAPDFDHFPDGYPEFTSWPNSWRSLTHQAMYYRWLERAWRGGLRLFVQHATGNSVLCELVAGSDWQQIRYDCNDMVSVDRQIAEAYAMERYIDAQAGGPGQGFFRIVTSPAQAREVIAEGKLAVLMGIEISNIFDCFVNAKPGHPLCTPESVREKLDTYHEMGIRALFPVHKYDNGFSAGDGQRGIIELGNMINSGHWSNFTNEACPEAHSVFDKGPVTFGDANQPREQYDAEPPNDFSGFFDNPLGTLLPLANIFMGPSLEGEYCQNAGLTPLGETLLLEMMSRGMIIEVDHLPKQASERAYEMLVENDYPAAATHGNNHDGLIYEVGGISNTKLGRCAEAGNPKAMISRLHGRVAQKTERGGHASEGLGFDLNGFAHGPRPRFGDDSRCGEPQENPVEYPFMSLDGAVTFTAPYLGNRAVDFNTEGMIHIGLLPELIEDVRRNGVTDEDLEPLFRSAEGYLQMWERAESRAAALNEQ